MASIVYFRKVHEDPEVVRYEFGWEPDEMDRTLSMDTHTRRPSHGDRNADYQSLKASRKISSLYREMGTWPDQGMSVS